MGMNHQYNASRPTLAEVGERYGLSGRDHPVCKFCQHPDLRVGGFERETFLCCPACGADGPIAKGVPAAVAAYHGKRYSFDDLNFGTLHPSGRCLDERLVPRPPGLKNADWYKFTGALLRHLNPTRRP